MEKLFSRVISFGFYLLFIIVPLILTPWNYELFEFNKMLAVYALTAIIVGGWLGRMILQKRILFKKNPLDLPLALFLISQVVSFLFSIDRHTSFWGYYSRFHGGLLSTVCYLLLYWAFVSNMNKNSALFSIHCSLFTATLVSLYGILEHFGHSLSCLLFLGRFDVSCWVQDVQNRVFATLGQPNWLAAYLTILIPISLGFVLIANIKKQKANIQSKNLKRKYLNFAMYFYYLLFSIYYLCFLYTKSQSGLLAILISLTAFWAILFFFASKQKLFHPKQLLRPAIIYGLLFIILFSSVGFSAYPELKGKLAKIGLFKPFFSAETITPATTEEKKVPLVGGSPSGEIRKIVWKGAIEIFKHYPAFGSGVETFAYSYYNFRPVEHNFVSEWDFLYNKAHNEYLNFLATTGLLGLGTYLLFIFSFIWWFIRINTNFYTNNHKSPIVRDNSRNIRADLYEETSRSPETNGILLIGIFTGWLTILVTNFFGFSVVTVALFFFLIPAFCFVLAQPEPSSPTPIALHLSSATKILLLILLSSISYFLFSIANLWRADVYYALGEKNNQAGQTETALKQLSRAINLNPKEPVYRNEFAEAAANEAVLALKQKGATLASELVQSAILSSERALTTSPRNLNFWKGQIKIFYTLAQINKDFSPLVLDALKQTVILAPTDPKLRYNLGVAYVNSGQTDLALATLKEAIELKPDYKDPRFALALILKEKKEIKGAQEQLEYILKNISPGDSASAELLKTIK